MFSPINTEEGERRSRRESIRAYLEHANHESERESQIHVRKTPSGKLMETEEGLPYGCLSQATADHLLKHAVAETATFLNMPKYLKRCLGILITPPLASITCFSLVPWPNPASAFDDALNVAWLMGAYTAAWLPALWGLANYMFIILNIPASLKVQLYYTGAATFTILLATLLFGSGHAQYRLDI